MNQIITLVLFSVFFITNTFSQKNLSDYSFVVVPDRYDFLFEKDQYQLNSLSKFLFNKHGFNAYFNKELPNVNRCDGLWADAEKDSGFIWTRITIVLKDCKGNEVYRSIPGRSKLKDYGKSYVQAIRNSFESFVGEEVNQVEPKILVEKPDSVTVIEENDSKEEEIIPEKAVETLTKSDLFYTNNGNTFVLQENKEGYFLYRKDGDTLEPKGSLYLKKDSSYKFKDISGNEFPCFFDSGENLIIESSFDNLVFKKVD